MNYFHFIIKRFFQKTIAFKVQDKYKAEENSSLGIVGYIWKEKDGKNQQNQELLMFYHKKREMRHLAKMEREDENFSKMVKMV